MGYQRASADAPRAPRQRDARAAVNIFMLKAPASASPANPLAASWLQDVAFWLPERAVSGGETARFAAQNVPHWKSERRIREAKAGRAVFSCIFASMAERRHPLRNRACSPRGQ